ncbi:MAG: lipopolysaccharide biosynthesis protein [Alphaproteobacteria bacterium]|nr:MAG: lipopolysaccharide biosynthesis protein [Alphaproteobacteria bacterium]
MTQPESDLSHYKTGRARRAFSGVLWSGFNAVVPALSSLVVFSLVSRVVSPEEFGFVAFAVAIVSTIGAFSPAGFGDALIQRKELKSEHLNTTFWICLLWGILLYGGTAILAGLLASSLGVPMLGTLLPVVGIRLIFELGVVVPTALLNRQMQFRQLAVRTLVASVISMVACLLVLYLGHGLWALVISQIVGAGVIFVVSWLSIKWRPTANLSLDTLSELKSFGGYASASRLITSINLEQLLIGSMLNSAALGVYAFARRIFQIINDVLSGALAGVAYPLLSSMQDEPEKLRDVYLATTFLSSVFAFPIFVGLAIIANDALPLVFGAQWGAAVIALQAFCAIGLLSCIGILQAALLRARGRVDFWTWYQVGQQTLTAITIVLLARFGMTAVFLGMAIKSWLTVPFVAILVCRMVGIPLNKYAAQFWPPLFGCLMMGGGIFCVRYGLKLSPITTLSLEIAVGAITYSTVVVLTAGRRLSEILKMIKSRR